MKILRYLLLTVGCLFTVPIVLYILAFMRLLPSGFLERCWVFFFVDVAYWFYKVGDRGLFWSDAGHVAHLTVVGILLIYALPAGFGYFGFWKLKKTSHETHAA